MESYCKNCHKCCELIPSLDNNILRDGIQICETFFKPIDIITAQNINENYVKKVQNELGKVEYLTCTYLMNGVCANPRLPIQCIKFPQNPNAIVPDECIYLGKVFWENEKLKQKIRKIKEEITNYESLILSNKKEENSYRKIINNLQRQVDKYRIFGSDNW